MGNWSLQVSAALISLSLLVTMPLYAVFGPWMISVIFIVPSILSTVYMYRNLSETSGREIGDIVQELMK
jgi:hypothetical protein